MISRVDDPVMGVADDDTYQKCTGAGVSEWAPAGVLTVFENRSGAGVSFLIRGYFAYY